MSGCTATPKRSVAVDDILVRFLQRSETQGRCLSVSHVSIYIPITGERAIRGWRKGESVEGRGVLRNWFVRLWRSEGPTMYHLQAGDPAEPML